MFTSASNFSSVSARSNALRARARMSNPPCFCKAACVPASMKLILHSSIALEMRQSPRVTRAKPVKRALLMARAAGVHITSELALAASCLRSEKIIAVTGAVGKSTTVSLLAEGSRTFDSNNIAVGNIGKPLAEYVVEVLQGKRARASWLCLELSSFQLENFENLSADHSIITFFTSNHLERYKDLQQYYETKWSLVEKTKGCVFINAKSPELLKFSENKKNSKVIPCSPGDANLKDLHLSESLLLGEHNQQNLAVVGAVIEKVAWPKNAVTAIKNFPGLKHRLENLGFKHGIRFVNDSKATALDSVISAVDSLIDDIPENSFLHLMLGGKDKNLPWQQLSSLKKFPRLKVSYFGETAEKAKKGSGLEGPVFAKIGIALDQIFLLLKHGDTLLLSPGGTSQDEFKNFEERGDFFKKKVLDQFS